MKPIEANVTVHPGMTQTVTPGLTAVAAARLVVAKSDVLGALIPYIHATDLDGTHLVSVALDAKNADHVVLALLRVVQHESQVAADIRECLRLFEHLSNSGRLDSLPDGAFTQFTALVERLRAHVGAITGGPR